MTQDQAYLAVMLVSSHLVGDFFLQSSATARTKPVSWSALFRHVAFDHGPLVVAVFALFLEPRCLTLSVGAVLGSHLLIDLLRAPTGGTGTDAGATRPRGPAWRYGAGWSDTKSLLVDQFVHLAVIGAVVVALTSEPSTVVRADWLAARGTSSRDWLAFLAFGLITWAAIAMVGKGGNVIVHAILRDVSLLPSDGSTSASDPESRVVRMGRTIGVLERMLLVVLLLLEAYGSIGMVIAAKSLVRFPLFHRGDGQPSKIAGIDAKDVTEYFLIGSLASILVAFFLGLAVRMLLVSVFGISF